MFNGAVQNVEARMKMLCSLPACLPRFKQMFDVGLPARRNCVLTAFVYLLCPPSCLDLELDSCFP
jgi:hypothetical protein